MRSQQRRHQRRREQPADPAQRPKAAPPHHPCHQQCAHRAGGICPFSGPEQHGQPARSGNQRSARHRQHHGGTQSRSRTHPGRHAVVQVPPAARSAPLRHIHTQGTKQRQCHGRQRNQPAGMRTVAREKGDHLAPGGESRPHNRPKTRRQARHAASFRHESIPPRIRPCYASETFSMLCAIRKGPAHAVRRSLWLHFNAFRRSSPHGASPAGLPERA